MTVVTPRVAPDAAGELKGEHTHASSARSSGSEYRLLYLTLISRGAAKRALGRAPDPWTRSTGTRHFPKPLEKGTSPCCSVS